MRHNFGELPTYKVNEKVIVPVHWDSVWHNATIVEWEPWANEKQKSKYVRVVSKASV